MNSITQGRRSCISEPRILFAFLLFAVLALQDGFSENEAMRNGTYPYNQAGQAQLEELFASGITKN